MLPAVATRELTRAGSVIALIVRLVPRLSAFNESPSSFISSPKLKVAPEPSRPFEPLPQHLIVESSKTAQVCASPALTAFADLAVPRSTTASASPISPLASPMSEDVPTPSRPAKPRPQHLIVALSNNAHVCAEPAEIEFAVRPVPSATALNASAISPAASPRSSVSPYPRRPLPLPPQHFTVLLSRIAQECASPALIAFAVRLVPKLIALSAAPISPAPSPIESTDPIPSWPNAPPPQHLIFASSSSAHVCVPPALTATTVRFVPSEIAVNASPISFASSPRSSISPRPS